MSIFDKLFGSTTPVPQQQVAQPNQVAQPGNVNPNAPAPDPANPTVPNGTVEASKSPLDQHSELWQPAPVDPNANQPLLSVDPAKLAEAARKTDFAKLIQPELFAQIQQGGEGAAQAFAKAMNQVAQGVYAQSAFATSKIVEQAVQKAQEKFTAGIPEQIKQLQVSDSLRQGNPVFNHPAASPILGALESQMIKKFPQASASEITSMAQQYLDNFARMVQEPARAAEAAAAKKSSKETDWSQFIQ